jgi:hypothetical protein
LAKEKGGEKVSRWKRNLVKKKVGEYEKWRKKKVGERVTWGKRKVVNEKGVEREI